MRDSETSGDRRLEEKAGSLNSGGERASTVHAARAAGHVNEVAASISRAGEIVLKRHGSSVLMRVCAYIGGGIVLLWLCSLLNEVIDLPHLILAVPPTPVNWGKVVIDSVVVVCTVGLVFFMCSRIVREGRMAEQSLRQSEEKFAKAFRASPNLMSITTLDGRIIDTNDAYCTLAGYSREELIGKSVLEFNVWADPEQRKGMVEQVRKEGSVHELQVKLRTKSGQIRMLLFSAETITYAGESCLVSVATDITERKRAEEALRESEERFRRLYEQAPLGYQSLDAEGCFIDVNQAWLDLLGYSHEQVIGHWFGDFLAPQEVGALKQRFSRFKAAGEVHVDLEMIQSAGSTIIVHIDGRIGHDEHGQFKQTHCILHDITAQKRAEEALKKSAQLLRDTGEMAKVGGWELDLSTKEVFCTEETCRIHGIEPGYKLSLEEALTFYAPESIPPLKATLKKIAETGEPYDLESLFIPRGSTDKIWVRSLGMAVYSGGKIVKLTGTFQNIDKYKRAEDALRESEQKYRELFENAREAILTVDLEGKITDVNKLIEEYGFKREELIGKRLFDFVPECDKARAVSDFDTLIGGNMVPGEMDVITPRGIFTVEYRDNPIVRAGNVVGVQSILTDITERKKAEERLKAERQRLYDVLETLPVMVCLLTPDYHVTFTNRVFRQKFGEDNGRCCYDYIFGRKGPCEFCEAYNVLKIGNPIIGNVQARMAVVLSMSMTSPLRTPMVRLSSSRWI